MKATRQGENPEGRPDKAKTKKAKDCKTKNGPKPSSTPRQHHAGVHLSQGCDIKAYLNATGIERQPGPTQEDAPLTIPGHALPIEIRTQLKRQAMDHKHSCPSDESHGPPTAPGGKKNWTNEEANTHEEKQAKAPDWPPGKDLQDKPIDDKSCSQAE